MNRYNTDTNGALVENKPLFASVWMALFYVLRKSLNERRQTAYTNTESSQAVETNRPAL